MKVYIIFWSQLYSIRVILAQMEIFNAVLPYLLRKSIFWIKDHNNTIAMIFWKGFLTLDFRNIDLRSKYGNTALNIFVWAGIAKIEHNWPQDIDFHGFHELDKICRRPDLALIEPPLLPNLRSIFHNHKPES